MIVIISIHFWLTITVAHQPFHGRNPHMEDGMADSVDRLQIVKAMVVFRANMVDLLKAR